MLALLGDVAMVMPTRDERPVTPTVWMRAEPRPTMGERFELAPGIWIVREKQWWPASVLDTAALAPVIDPDVEITRRNLPQPDWHGSAACVSVDEADKLFFGVDDVGRPALPPRYFRAARAICAQCPVRRECLTHALTQPEHFGIWGGSAGRQRVPMLAAVRRGEPVDAVVSAFFTRLAA